MTTLSVSIDIDAPSERTWQLVTDWPRQGEWMPLTQVRVPVDSPSGVGATFAARSGLGLAGFLDTMVVDVWEPPHRCEVVHLGRVVTGRGVFLIHDLPGDRSRFTWREELDSTGPRRIIDRAGALPTRMFLTLALKRLARLVVAEAA
jgi:hypothetical protein